MGIPHREELVGKRFLVVSGLVKPKISKIHEWKWRAGVIRAVDKSSRGKDPKEAIVYVEVDSLDWQKREWLKVQDPAHQAFLVEKGLVWGERIDPYANKPNTVQWPALNFEVLVDRVGITSAAVRPLEFLVDQHLSFVKEREIQPFKDEDVETSSRAIFERYPDVREETQKWLHEQKEQFVLMQGPYLLTGIRVKVYRLGSTTQWFTAVITCHDLLTRDLDVMDDTVLETHTENPAHVQMMFLDDVVNALLKGENVGITRRNNRNTTTTPAVTTSASSTTHTRPAPRSQSPSHAPTSQPIVAPTTTNKKKRSTKDKDVARIPTPPTTELPEKADKTIEKPVKEKTVPACSGTKNRKERKRKSGDPTEEDKKSSSPSLDKRPRSNSGSSVSSQERTEPSAEATTVSSNPHEAKDSRSSKSEERAVKVPSPIDVRVPTSQPAAEASRTSSDVSYDGKTKNKPVTRPELAITDSKDSRSSTPDSVKQRKHRSKKENKDKSKQQESVETAPLTNNPSLMSNTSSNNPALRNNPAANSPVARNNPARNSPDLRNNPALRTITPSSQSVANVPVSTSACSQMVELKTDASSTPTGELSNTLVAKEHRSLLRGESLTSAIAGIIARELSRDVSTEATPVGKRSEVTTSGVLTSKEEKTSIADQKPANVSCVPSAKTSESIRLISSGLNLVHSTNSVTSTLPHRTLLTSHTVPVISHGNGTLTVQSGMDKNVLSHKVKENPRIPSANQLSGKPFAEHPILGERINRESKEIRREASSIPSEGSESVKSIPSKDFQPGRLEKKSSLVTDLTRPVEVYRDPNLSDSEVIHVDSIQHHPAHLMKIADPHTPSPSHPITPSPHALRNPSAPPPGAATPSAVAASPSAFVPAPPAGPVGPVGHIPGHHPVAHPAMFPAAHLQLYPQHPLASQLAVAGHFPQHPLASLDSHSLQHQLHAQRIAGLVQPDPLARIRMEQLHRMMSPQQAAAIQVHHGLTPAQIQALQQQHPGLPLAPSWVLSHEELDRVHLQQREQQKSLDKTPPGAAHHTSPSSQPDLKARLDPTKDKLPPSSTLHSSMHPSQHAGHPHHPGAVSQAAMQGLVAAQESSARDAAHHSAAARMQQVQELDAQAAVQQHFQESLRKLQVPFSFSTPTTGGSITEGTALPKTKSHLPKEVMERQQRDRQDHEERLRREREEKELEWQRIQREKERKHPEPDPRLRYPGGEGESAYKHAVSEAHRLYDEQVYRQALGLRYQEDLAAQYHMEHKPESKIKPEKTEIGARVHDGQGFKPYPSMRTDSHTVLYRTMAVKEEPRAGVPVRTEHNRQLMSAAYKPKPDNLVGYQPFLHTMSSGHGGEKAPTEGYTSRAEEYKMAANMAANAAAAKQGARKGIPTPPPLIKREMERHEAGHHQTSRSERVPDAMHHSVGAFTSASSSHGVHPSHAGHHVSLSDMKTNNEGANSVPVIKHMIGTPPPLHSSSQPAATTSGRPTHIPPQSPLKVATPQQLSAAVMQIGPHASTSTTSAVGHHPHHAYSTTTTATTNTSLLMSALRPADREAMDVDPASIKRKSGLVAATVHKKRPKTKEDALGNHDKKDPSMTSYIEQFHNFVMEPNSQNPQTTTGNATVGKASENIELKIEKVDQYRRLNLDSSAPAVLMSADAHKSTNGALSDSDRCASPRSTASDSSDGRSLKSASPHRSGGPVYLKKAWLARHSESKAPVGSCTSVTQGHTDPKQDNTKLSSSLPNGHLTGTFSQISQGVDADKAVTIDDIPKSIPNHVYDFDQDKMSTCSEASTTSSHKSRSRKSGKESRSSKKKDRKNHGSPSDAKKEKGDKKTDKNFDDVEKHKSEYLLGLEACRQLPNNAQSKSTVQLAELLSMIAAAAPNKKRKTTRTAKETRDAGQQLNVSRALVKPSLAKLKRSGEAFLQDGMCCDITPNLMKCRECRIKPTAKQSKLNIFCRFYAFRRLKYSNKGNLTIAGFSEPEHCDTEDLNPWLPYPPDESNLDLDTSLYIISRVGPQFCKLVQQEQEAKNWCTNPGKIAWKRAVTGVREMCDTCDTTLFNIHWTCSKCGFVVCLDCYHARSKQEKNSDINAEDRMSAKWLKCIKDQPHQPDGLMLTQIIPGNALWDVGALVHQVCLKWQIASACPCLGGDTKALVNGKSPVSGQGEWKQEDLLSSMALSGHIANSRQNRKPQLTSLPTSSLDILADIAASRDGKCGIDGRKLDVVDKACSADVEANLKGEPCSTLRDLLMKTAGKHKTAGSDGNILSAFLPNSNSNSKRTSRTMTSTFEDIIATVVEQNIAAPGKERSGTKTPRLSISSETEVNLNATKPVENKKLRNSVNKNTLVESSVKYPDVPHSWLCDGRLLRLHDPAHPGNMAIWQEQWRKGEPILVSNCHKQLDEKLWHPDFFNKHFGHLENDLVDCQSGDVITGAPMRDFWNGFEDITNRLETNDGDPIILKLKDWPPAEDFSELLPQHFQDLMNNLPLPDYTRRDGRLNLSARLPDFFVKPDLGPKMYNAFGVARYPSTGTTNLHLDISDAVNVMVYVGMPKGNAGQETCDLYEKEALDAVDHACPDEQTRKRVREDKERPGAIWHLFRACDTNKIREFLIKLSKEQGEDVPADHDPIHDQSWYLDNPMLDRLYKEYGVQGWAITQCWGDAIFIPAGAPHQVRNMHSSIKVAEDFVSPEHISHCFWLTQEFRALSATHSNHEDKLQIKNIIYHALKDTIGLLMTKTPPDEQGPGNTAPQRTGLPLGDQQQLQHLQPQQLKNLQHHHQPQLQQKQQPQMQGGSNIPTPAQSKQPVDKHLPQKPSQHSVQHQQPVGLQQIPVTTGLQPATKGMPPVTTGLPPGTTGHPTTTTGLKPTTTGLAAMKHSSPALATQVPPTSNICTSS